MKISGFLIRKLTPGCFVLSMVAVAFAQSPAPTPNRQLVKVEYDATKDLTQISLDPFVLASRKLEELRLGAISGYPGKTRSKPKEITLIVLSLSRTDESRYGVTRKLSAVADGQRFEWGETRHAKEAQNGLFIEVMTANVPMDDFLAVSKAKAVKIKIGLTEVELSSAQINILRLTASYITD
jgi:hypothetical protein